VVPDQLDRLDRDGAGEESMTVLDTIGRTRLIPLRHIVPEKSARILVKLEYENPTGSMKDRMALAMIECAHRSIVNTKIGAS
jgi:cysteine synthase